MSVGTTGIEIITFGINSDEENLKNGFTQIISDNLYNTNGDPVNGGVYDLRLGTTDHNHLCNTCQYGKKLCPGHRGYLQLKAAVLQPIGINEVRQWLKVICLNCGKLVVDKSKIDRIPIPKRMYDISLSGEGKTCPYCGTLHPKIKKDKEDRFTFWISYQITETDSESPESSSKPETDEYINASDLSTRHKKLYPDTIMHIFSKVTEETLTLLGKTSNSHPKNLTLKVISIPPNTIRPGIKSFNGEGSSYNDATNLLQHIVKRNGQLPDKLPDYIYDISSKTELAVENKELDKSLQNLQLLYFELIYGSDSTNALQGNSGKRGLVIGNRPIHSFLRVLPRKEGRIRLNLLGKRSFFTSRSTISGNVNYKIDEVGFPIEFAKVLQVEEYVQDFNMEFLTSIFLNGRNQYPGCSHVIKKSTGEMHDVSKLTDYYLEIGDMLYRDIIDGDHAFFNRAPTLERSSICVHKIVIIKDPSIHTFQMNVLACTLYNADFDGDQMNIWIARGVGQRVEASIMSTMSNWFISTKTSGTVNGQVQDSIVGCYEITRSSTRIDKYHAIGLFSKLSLKKLRFDTYKRDHIFTGRDIMSILLSETPINYEHTPATYDNELYKPYINYDKNETFVEIKNGQMLSGVLDSSSVGDGSKGGIFHLVSREYGKQVAIEVIYSMQQIVLQYLLWHGFTVGTENMILSRKSIEQTNASVSATLLESELITNRLLEGKIIAPVGFTIHDFHEQQQKNILQPNTSELFRWVLESIDPNSNNFFKMILCGSKGKTPNLVNIMSSIGPSVINGKRMKENFSFRRTLPYCTRFSNDPKSYGFVSNSYISGMTSTEFIFQDMANRFDLISKALATATTGYFMRKCVMNNQSSIVDNYRRVTKDTKIVQFLYGEDGLDSRELEDVQYKIATMTDSDLRNYITPTDPNGLESEIEEWLKMVKDDRHRYRYAYDCIESADLVPHSDIKKKKSNDRDEYVAYITVPVNIHRIITNVLKQNSTLATKLSLEKINKVKYLYNNISYALLNEIQESRKSPVPLYRQTSFTLICMLIRAELRPKTLELISEEQLDHIIRLIRLRYANSLIDYGTAVGILAAQSISEPLTQYMLDSHHRSVGSGTSKSGVIRINELYSMYNIDKEATPMMVIPVNSNVFSKEKNINTLVLDLSNSIEYLTFEQFIKNKRVLLEPYQYLIHPVYKHDSKWIKEFEESHPLVSVPTDLTNWCFRYEIDKSTLVLKGVDLELIVHKLKAKHVNTFIVFTPESSPDIIIRIWHKPSKKRGIVLEEVYTKIMTDILETPIRGIKRIMHAKMEKRNKFVVSNDNGFTTKEHYLINTNGTNLYNVLLYNKAFDTTCVVSNSIPDTYDIYGIEAARVKIINETRVTIASSNINIRHLYIYADERTRTGRVTSIERGGMAVREHNNILLRASHQDPIRNLIDAAMNNTKSNVYGIVAPQILGMTPKIGTMYNSVVINEDFVQHNVQSVDEILDLL
jgi:DNA-directed RNA polymerase II subunit RPB1